MTLAGLFVGAYLFGGVPFGFLLARARGVDIRTVGSGNIGASNVARTLGRAWGVLVLALDAGKGLAPVLVARRLALPEWALAGAGLAAVLGHTFSPFLGFRGGKGVATGLGVALGIAPLAALAAFGVYLLVFLPWRISSLGSLAAAISFPLFMWLFGQASWWNLAFGALAAGLIVVRHRSNIARLLRGDELRA